MNIKNCPCGHEVYIEKKTLAGYKGAYIFDIHCEKCGCTIKFEGNDTVYRSEEEARNNVINTWNRFAGARPEGHWAVKKTDNGPKLYCSVCGVEYKTGIEYGKFCGNCGAEMSGFYASLNHLK